MVWNMNINQFKSYQYRRKQQNKLLKKDRVYSGQRKNN